MGEPLEGRVTQYRQIATKCKGNSFISTATMITAWKGPVLF